MIQGEKELEKALRDKADIRMEKAVAKGILLVQENAKAECPVHDGELKRSIYTDVETKEDSVEGICYTNKKYATYVEFGTGPKGQENHEGISPDVAVAYTQSPWWIHESQIDREVAEKYHFFGIDTPQGRFYQCTGQPAKPFLYTALKNNEEEVVRIVREELQKQL